MPPMLLSLAMSSFGLTGELYPAFRTVSEIYQFKGFCISYRPYDQES